MYAQNFELDTGHDLDFAVSGDTALYTKRIERSKRVRWDIDTDVIRGRHFDLTRKFLPDGLSKSTWAVLGWTCLTEFFTQAHYRKSIHKDDNLSELYKDVFLYHWREECQHAVLDELALTREDRKLSDEERDRGVDDLIDLVAAVDGILRVQTAAVRPLNVAFFDNSLRLLYVE